MGFSIQNRIAEKQNTTVKNNAQIVAYQAEHIGKLEREFAAGVIDRAEYVRRYAEVSEIIRAMGKE